MKNVSLNSKYSQQPFGKKFVYNFMEKYVKMCALNLKHIVKCNIQKVLSIE